MNTKLTTDRYTAARKADRRGALHAARAYLVNQDFSKFDDPAKAEAVAHETLADLCIGAIWAAPSEHAPSTKLSQDGPQWFRLAAPNHFWRVTDGGAGYDRSDWNR